MRFNILNYIKFFNIKIKTKNKYSEIDNDDITKIRIALVDFHRKYDALSKENIKLELEYLLDKFGLQIIDNFIGNEDYFNISDSDKTELLRSAYVDRNGVIYLKGIAQISTEEE